MQTFKIAVIPGDGIGPEVTSQAVKVLEHVASKYGHEFRFQEALMGGIAVTGASHVDTGVYTVTFSDAKVPSDCAFTAGIGSTPGANQQAALVNVGATNIAGTIGVRTYSAQTRAPADLPFNVYVAC